MAFFVARRLLYLVPVLIAVSLLTFSIASLLPGDLAYTILGDQATPENVAALRADMGLDQPIWWRYLSWLGNVMQGDFGRSFRTGQTVLQAVAERLPVSIELMLLAQLGALAIGGSLRYDFGSANGFVSGHGLAGHPGSFPKDMNGDNVISAPETKVGFLPAGNTSPVDYDYNYLSYSAGVNYRISEPLAVFARARTST